MHECAYECVRACVYLAARFGLIRKTLVHLLIHSSQSDLVKQRSGAAECKGEGVWQMSAAECKGGGVWQMSGEAM